MDIGEAVQQVFQGYRSLQEAHPVLGAMITAEVIYPLSDIASQLITDKTVNWRKVRYTAALAPMYGIGTYGLLETGDLVGEYVSSHPLVRAALGPNLFANAFNMFFFVNNTVGEKSNHDLEALANNYGQIVREGGNLRDYVERFKENILRNIPIREYLHSVAAVTTVWNGFQWFNYSHIPDELQTPATLAASLGWMVLLSLWSLKGGRGIAKRNE